MTGCFQKELRFIEEQIQSYYALNASQSALDYLVNYEDLIEATGTKPQSSSAGLYLVAEAAEQCFMGLYLPQEVIHNIEQNPPSLHLHNGNLNSYWVCVEEVCHFHQLLTRFEQKRVVSRLELELQGEVDKLLFAALLLQKQNGFCGIRLMAYLLFEKSVIFGDELYQEASRLAAQFWYPLINFGIGEAVSLLSEKFVEFMRINYHQPLAEKQFNRRWKP